MEGSLLNIVSRGALSLWLMLCIGCVSTPPEPTPDPERVAGMMSAIPAVEDPPEPGPPQDLWERIRRQLSFQIQSCF